MRDAPSFAAEGSRVRNSVSRTARCASIKGVISSAREAKWRRVRNSSRSARGLAALGAESHCENADCPSFVMVMVLRTEGGAVPAGSPCRVQPRASSLLSVAYIWLSLMCHKVPKVSRNRRYNSYPCTGPSARNPRNTNSGCTSEIRVAFMDTSVTRFLYLPSSQVGMPIVKMGK